MRVFHAGAVPVRFRILGILFFLCFVNYLLRNSLSVAAPSIRAEYGFSSAELGWILGSFNLTYALLQIPGGLFGEKLGPRRALALIAVTWGALTAATGFSPDLFSASAAGAMVSLVAVRLLMGLANAPLFPVAAAAFANWFPVGGWAFPNAMLSAGLTLGQAVIGPVVTALIVWFGWRESFYALAPLGLIAGAWWWWYGRDTPAEHPDVTPGEIARIQAGRGAVHGGPRTDAGWRAVLGNRDVWLITGGYFCMNYVFYMFAQWLFTYLVEERGFSLLTSGMLYALPFVTGTLFATLGGLLCDRLCRSLGMRRGCGLTGMTGLVLVAAFLLMGTYATRPYVAVAALALCFGFTQLTEGAFWSASTSAAGPHTATATGLMNTGGNLAGLLAPLVGFMVDGFGWAATLASGSAFALAGAALWLVLLLDRRALEPRRP